MTFEKYLIDNCGQRILESLTNTDPDNLDCTFPGRILDDESFDLGRGTFCRAKGLDVERVYYKPCDRDGSSEDDGYHESELEFILLLKVEFLTFRVAEDSVSEPSLVIRKYYASCTADIDDGMLRNFQVTDIHDRNLMAELDIEMRCRQKELSRFPVMAMTNEELERRADTFLEKYYPEAREVPMRVPVRTIFREAFGMELDCSGNENRFTMTCEACRRLWDASALKLNGLLDDGDGNSPFSEEMRRIMDRNAKRTAAAILMPAASLTPGICGLLGAYEEELKSEDAGSLLKYMIYNLAQEYEVSVQAMKIRLEDLGFAMFSGVLNHLDGEYIPAFTTSEDARVRCERYLIGMSQLKELLSDRPELMRLCEQEELVYIEGKLVLNECRYVQVEEGERTLTPYARSHVDECCIRFGGMPGRGWKQAACSMGIYAPGRLRRTRRNMRQAGFAGPGEI